MFQINSAIKLVKNKGSIVVGHQKCDDWYIFDMQITSEMPLMEIDTPNPILILIFVMLFKCIIWKRLKFYF